MLVRKIRPKKKLGKHFGWTGIACTTIGFTMWCNRVMCGTEGPTPDKPTRRLVWRRLVSSLNTVCSCTLLTDTNLVTIYECIMH